VPRRDRLLAKLFAPGHIEKTLDALVAAQAVTLPEDAAMEAARCQFAEADRKLARHRLALEAGADPEVVTAWIREEQAKKTEAQATWPPGSPGRAGTGYLGIRGLNVG
jgi:hypothetical protein